MEPVPETKRMEEFKRFPVTPLRHANVNANGHAAVNGHAAAANADVRPGSPGSNVTAFDLDLDLSLFRKPPPMRRSTDPNPTFSPVAPSTPSWSPSTMASLPYRPRTASPLSGSHARSRSMAVPMSRTQSMPGHMLGSPQLRSASPSRSPSRTRVPRKPADDVFPLSSPVRASVVDLERRPTPADRSGSPILGTSCGAWSSRLLRPASPLRNLASASHGALPPLPSTPSSSPSMSSSSRSYDAFAPYGGYGYGGYGGALSSVPSTPTSARSRSPSISSLETIPDSPDAEEAALEAERLAQLKAAADAADGSGDGSDHKARATSDTPLRGRTMMYGARDKRKRWSVCGAERRGDLDLETIWED
ncbi:hypothetical protein DCS_03909 [Drechmeria coniospora]|uniref:Basic proline-rich protein n=1 Tax=Drechmeria coniospora TaxID=98403 RepID=A0A151GIF3_DRECN|nr:hypothetical protein DCS_03909 [Drechmeria coniospora]KYK56903.1 hypothetical protein DCS_03909 [Drechmeria coniospora]